MDARPAGWTRPNPGIGCKANGMTDHRGRRSPPSLCSLPRGRRALGDRIANNWPLGATMPTPAPGSRTTQFPGLAGLVLWPLSAGFSFRGSAGARPSPRLRGAPFFRRGRLWARAGRMAGVCDGGAPPAIRRPAVRAGARRVFGAPRRRGEAVYTFT